MRNSSIRNHSVTKNIFVERREEIPRVLSDKKKKFRLRYFPFTNPCDLES